MRRARSRRAAVTAARRVCDSPPPGNATKQLGGTMETKANPAPLGLIGFAATTWLLSLINAGIFGQEAMPLVLGMALAFGGGAQVLAGILSYLRGNTFA